MAEHSTPAPDPSLDRLTAGLTTALSRAGLPAPASPERLSGGANMESWRFVAGDATFVLRRAPGGDTLTDGRAITLATEAALIHAARSAGVMAPEVVLELLPDDNCGVGFVMRAMPGTPDPASILGSADPAALLTGLAHELAVIHRVPAAELPELPELITADGVAALRERFLAAGGDRPVLALGLHWLEQNLPPPVPPRLVHGDFRIGNLLVEAGKLSGVLDWELAHLGDPHEDLAYGCMTVWRFSRPDRPALGLGSVEELAGAYVAAGGERFDPARFRFWLIYRTVWWALGCLQMGETWRSGLDRSLERVVVARRCAEQELDLLLLLESDAPDAERQRVLSTPPESTPAEPVHGEPVPARTGEPDAAEILEAVGEWLARDIKPLTSGRDRFMLAVARNALGIAGRELRQQPVSRDPALAARLLSGATNLAEPGLLARLRRMTLDKLSADMPKYPALAATRARWDGPANADAV